MGKNLAPPGTETNRGMPVEKRINIHATGRIRNGRRRLRNLYIEKMRRVEPDNRKR